MIHRDYFNLADVRVFIFDDRIEVVSPGPFPEGVTPKKPKHKPVNKILSDLMYDIGYIEKCGSGIYLENELCLKNGNPKPVYEIDPIQTKVIFKSQVKDVTVVEMDDKVLEGLNERQKQALEYLEKHDFISRRTYMDLNNISNKTAFLELRDLVTKRILLKEGKGRAVIYRIKR